MSNTELLAGRYRVVRTIGAGGMGVVYLVEDTRQGNARVALKTLNTNPGQTPPYPPVNGGEEESFRSEFRNVHGVVHPNIPEVFDFGALADGTLYFTTEFVDGQPLDTLLEQWTPAQLQVALVSLCRALAFLHSRGLLHRDIKLENVLAKLEANGEFSTIKLVDFGLAAYARGPSEDVSGTIDYLAPELITGGAATVASDIYSLGMMLYRLATGRMPFDAQDPLALTKVRTTTEAPPPLRFRPDLPVGLSDVIGAMIRLRPDDRPASARHAIAMLNEREGTDFPYETAATRRAYLRSAESVTNVAARERLNAYVNLVRGGVRTPNVAILGCPGLGRKRLITEFATELALSGITTRVIESDADVLATPAGSVRAILVPEMRQVSLDLLVERVMQGRAQGEWWIIGADESDAEPTAMLIDLEAIHLQPLSLSGIRRFIAAMLPENTFQPPFAAEVYHHSLGLAVAAQDILDQLLEAGRLRIGLEGWELLPGPWNIPIQPSVAANIDIQMKLLPETSQVLVQELSCSLSPLPLQTLINLAEVKQHTNPYILDGAAELVRMGWLDDTSDGYFLTFRALAEHVRAGLSESGRHRLHRELAAAWAFENLSEHPRRTREVLFHDLNAATWLVPAAEARATLQATIEEGHTAWVRYLVEAGLANGPPPELRIVMLRALGEVEYIEGNLVAAAECLAPVIGRHDAPVTPESAADFVRVAMIEEKLGRTERAEGILRQCLELLDSGCDVNTGSVYGTLAWIAFKRGDAQQARQLAETGLVRVPPKAMDAGLALLLNTLGTLAFYSGDLDAAAMAWKRCLEVNEEIRDRKGIANMYNNLGVLAAQSGDRLQARALWQKCEEIAREINDLHRLSGIYNNLGIDALETGRLQQAEEYYVKALTMFRRLKSPRDQVELLSNLGELSYYRADYARAQAYWQEALHLAASVGDRESQVEPLVYLGKLLNTLEDLEKAETTLTKALHLAHELAVKKGEGQAWEGLAQLHARRGESDQSTAALRNAHAVLTEEVDPLACLHLHLTESAIAAEQGNESAIQEALARARKVADIKWDPFTAARTLVHGLLFAREPIDQKERSRILRQLSIYPDLLWKFHWASGRRLAAEGAIRKALEEYGRGVAVLKAIASRLSEDHRARYLSAPNITRFKAEALELRKSLQSPLDSSPVNGGE